jgi:hypothetical protein
MHSRWEDGAEQGQTRAANGHTERPTESQRCSCHGNLADHTASDCHNTAIHRSPPQTSLLSSVGFGQLQAGASAVVVLLCGGTSAAAPWYVRAHVRVHEHCAHGRTARARRRVWSESHDVSDLGAQSLDAATLVCMA